jgi:hypothetical protein
VTRQRKAWLGKARRGLARLGMATQGKAWLGKARQGVARIFKARRD